jgi:hypothetical protein
MASKVGGLPLITKIIYSITLLLLLVWVTPSAIGYYKNLESYDLKRATLQKIGFKYNITEEAKPFVIEEFKKENSSLFSALEVEIISNDTYSVVGTIDKSKVNKFNNFIESLSLHYLVKLKDNELLFDEKDELLEVKFSLKEL